MIEGDGSDPEGSFSAQQLYSVAAMSLTAPRPRNQFRRAPPAQGDVLRSRRSIPSRSNSSARRASRRRRRPRPRSKNWRRFMLSRISRGFAGRAIGKFRLNSDFMTEFQTGALRGADRVRVGIRLQAAEFAHVFRDGYSQIAADFAKFPAFFPTIREFWASAGRELIRGRVAQEPIVGGSGHARKTRIMPLPR